MNLKSILAPIAGDLLRVDTLIRARLSSEVALINEIGGYIINAGGKRLRPAVVLMSARALGAQGGLPCLLAVVIEFIHTATLLHDDVVDHSERRRGLKTANAVWGNAGAVLSGDFLYSRSFQLMVEADSMAVMRVMANTTNAIAEGEVLQLVTSNDTDTTEAQYLEVINAKTAALFAAASRIGAVLGERKETEEKALEAYGRNLGIAFQLVDDMLDYSARQAELGKTVGDDFRDGKITLPVVLALKAADGDERAFWRRTLETGEQRDGDLDRAIALMQRHGTLSATLERARLYAETARGALGIFHDSPERRALDETIDFCLERGY